MFAQALSLALDHSASAAQRAALEDALRQAVRLTEVESNFEARINESKARRGAPPTKAPPSVEAAIPSAEVIEAEQIASLQGLPATEIVQALKSGLDFDVQFWTGSLKQTHQADRPVVQELIDAKLALQAVLARCLADSPP